MASGVVWLADTTSSSIMFSIVSLILAYQSSRQAQEMQRDVAEKLARIMERLPSTFRDVKEKDWQEINESK